MTLQLSSGAAGLLFPLSLNVRATLLMQNRWPVGSGPSSNTWPRCASHYQIKHTKLWWASKRPKMYWNKITLSSWVCSTSLTFLQRTSVPALPRLLSGRRMMEVWLSSFPHVPWASLNEGQPVPESYLDSELLKEEGQSFQQRASTSPDSNNSNKHTWKGEHHSTHNGTFLLPSG